MYPVPGKKIWPKNEALTVSAANPKSRSREKTSEKIKVNLHSKGERRYPFTDILIIDGFKKPVQIRLKTNPVIDRFCKIYNDNKSLRTCAPGAQAILHAGICYLFSSSRSCRAGRLPAGPLIPGSRFLRAPGSRFFRAPGSSMEPADFFRREQEQMRMNMVF